MSVSYLTKIPTVTESAGFFHLRGTSPDDAHLIIPADLMRGFLIAGFEALSRSEAQAADCPSAVRLVVVGPPPKFEERTESDSLLVAPVHG